MFRIIFHSIGGDGIGHLARSVAVAEALVALDHRAIPLLLTECSDIRILYQTSLAYFTVPARYLLTDDQRWGNTGLGTMLWRKTAEVITQFFQPQIFVHDTFVYPDVVEYLRDMKIKQVLILRNRRDLGAYAEAHATLFESFDRIILPHKTDELPHLSSTDLPAGKTVFCGPVVRLSLDQLDVSEIYNRYGLLRDCFKVIVVNGGGGEYRPDSFLLLVSQALKKAQSQIDKMQVVLIYGPLFRGRWDHFLDLPNLRIRDFEPDLGSLMAAANLVIGRGGYNTIHEIQTIGVPALCIPAERGYDDQRARISAAAQTTSMLRLGAHYPEGLAAQIIEESMRSWFQFSPSCIDYSFSKGKYVAATNILQLISASD